MSNNNMSNNNMSNNNMSNQDVYLNQSVDYICKSCGQSLAIKMPDFKTLRDEFAMSALGHLINLYGDKFEVSREAISKMAYLYADKMLEARKL